MKRRVLILMILCAAPLTVAADSPLTSTPWHKAYLDIPQVKAASTGYKLTSRLARYLTDRSISLDKRAALVNALGWHPNGKENSRRLKKFLLRSRPQWQRRMPVDIALLYWYLAAMDRYQTPCTAAEKIRTLYLQMKDNQSAALLQLLVGSQQLLFTDWDPIWPAAQLVLTRHFSSGRIRQPALQIISNYMRFFKNSD